MDINQVKFGSYSIGNPKGGNARKSEQEAGTTQAQNTQSELRQLNADEMFNALNIAGMQNMAQINRMGSKMVDPKDYLSEDRISDIEAMMAGFEAGVDEVANTIEAEFPGMFAADKKYALAANIFAAE